MNTTVSTTKSLLRTILLTLSILSPWASADDTEIYTGGSISGTNLPNLVFLIDTSGSMRTTLDLATKGDYDPSQTYYGYCTEGRYYYASGTNVPDCRINGPDAFYVEPASFHCDSAAASLSSTGAGKYSDLYARGSASSWSEALSDTDHTSPIECQDDNSKHGHNTIDTTLATYPNSGGGWTSTSGNGIVWGSGSYDTSYTFYNANYVNWARMDRLSLVKNVYVTLMNQIAAGGNSLNLALMRFDDKNDEGGYFITPMDVLSTTNVATYNNAVLALTPGGSTPLSESLYEIYLYYAGKTSKYGHQSGPATNPASLYVNADTTTHVYKSPITNQCHKSFAILLTDGAPNSDTSATADIETLINNTNACSNKTDGDCLDELAGYMADNDCATPSPTLDQNVITYTIGFDTDDKTEATLTKTATAGKGKFFPAKSAQDLTNALADIIVQVNEISTTFTAPAVSINAYNRNFHSDELYYALFRPAKGPVWPGNIKVYKLLGEELVDQLDKAAINPATDFTYPNTLDLWSDLADFPTGNGEFVEHGGAAYKLTNTRNTYTYTGSGVPNNEDLTLGSNKLDNTNTANITPAMLGDPTMASGSVDHLNLLNWAHGLDVKDVDNDGDTSESRQAMGDPLHSRPVVVSYGPETNDLALFFGTNEGYLHALSIKNKGTEIFSFMPKELLSNIRKRYLDAPLSYHVYGMDGPITYWHNDLNNDGMLKNYNADKTATEFQTGEHIYLYAGMRRGNGPESPSYVDQYHNSYYALNVTDVNKPKLMWQITGGSTTGFEELAQTWSEMRHAKVKTGTATTDIKDVLIFGGGYDSEMSDQKDNVHTSDNRGRAIYMIDATTGKKIWEAGPTSSADTVNLTVDEMTNSIPSDIVIIDTNRDGLADRMYAADTGGQVWRFDINNGESDMSKFITGGVIAKLYGSTEAENRRFYYAPTVALSKDRSYFAIAIGSGQRSSPTNVTVQDAFFVLKDPYVYEVPTDGSGNPNYKYVDTSTTPDGIGDEVITWGASYTVGTKTFPHLFDATSNILGTKDGGTLANGSTTTTQVEIDAARALLAASYGWYMNLYDYDVNHDPLYLGEKVTANANIINNVVSFVTYTPLEDTATQVCEASRGRGLIYSVSLVDATAVYDSDGSGVVDVKDRVRQRFNGLPGPVQNVISESGWMDCSGMKCYEGGSLTPNKMNWDME